MRRRVALVLALWAAGPHSAAAQGGRPRMTAEITRDTVTVGDRFELRVDVSLPPGWRAELPPALPATAALQPLGGVRSERRTGGAAAVYPLVAWIPGQPRLPRLAIPIWGPDGAADTLRGGLPLPLVRSVLPPDTAGLRPRPPKPIVPDPRSSWLAGLALLGALLGVFAAAWAWRRRRLPERPSRPAVPRDARGDALRALDEVRRRSPAGAPLMDGTAEVVRDYLASMSPRWGVEATTGELVPRLRRDGARSTAADELAALLAAADRVKFAAVAPTQGEAEVHWSRARAWVGEFAPAAPPGPGEGG